MGLLGNIITKGVVTAARNSTIKAVGNAAVTVLEAYEKNRSSNPKVVIKNGITHIQPTRSSEGYCGENALDIARELLGAGFVSVTFKPVHRLGIHSRKRYGEVSSIAINGNEEFLGVKKVPASSYIVIKYLDFKQDVSKDVYTNIRLIPSDIVSNVSDLEMVTLNRDESTSPKRYCLYCGEPVSAEGARFCSGCGKQINEK